MGILYCICLKICCWIGRVRMFRKELVQVWTVLSFFLFLWNNVKSTDVSHGALNWHVCDMHQKCVRQKSGSFIQKISKPDSLLSGKNNFPGISQYLRWLKMSRDFLWSLIICFITFILLKSNHMFSHFRGHFGIVL